MGKKRNMDAQQMQDEELEKGSEGLNPVSREELEKMLGRGPRASRDRPRVDPSEVTGEEMAEFLLGRKPSEV